jgi:hypothetical protein
MSTPTESLFDWNQTISKEDSINRFYMDDSPVAFVDEGNENDVNNAALKQAAGIGLEIGGGIATDYATAPLLLGGPFGIGAYGVLNFGSGFGTNIAAQKTRGNENVDYGEAIAAGLIQMVPFGSTGKGVKGVVGAGIQGSVTAIGDQQIQTAINEQRLLTPKELRDYGAFGAVFGTGFKGSIDGIGKLSNSFIKKYSGKTAEEINQLITPNEIKKLEKLNVEVDNANSNIKTEQLSGTLKAEQDRIKALKEKKTLPNIIRKAKKKNQDLGDETITPNQVNPEQVSNTSKQFDLISKRIAQLKDQGAFSNVKTTEDTIDGGIAMLADTNKLKEHAKMYAKIYGLVPTDELNYALAEAVTLATQNTADINQRLINSINVTKDPAAIQTDINNLITSVGEIDEWLRLGLPLRTEQGRGLRSMQIPTQGVPYEEFAKMTAAEKYKLNKTGQSDISIKSSEQSLQLQDLKANLTKTFEEAQQTGDYTKLNKFANTIKRAAKTDKPIENMSALYRTDLLGRTLTQFNQGVRVFNEIGINALLSAPTTNEVNFLSGMLETYTSAFELALGAGSKTEFNAAIQHLIGLHSNFNFSLKAFDQSFKTSDNFVNRGAIKADYGERFIISSDDPGFVGKGINVAGKVIRFPSQLMTATDALIQAPNLIGSIHYQGHIEGIQQGLKGQELSDFVKGHIDGIIEYYASNSGKGIKDPITARILKRSQEFARRSTFTEDIRTDGYSGFGTTAKGINELANKVPLVRALMAFVRTPTNILKRQLRRTPALNYLLGELKNDLNSVDPIVRNQARGQLRLGSTLGGMIVPLVAVNAFRKDDPNYYPPTILTGGGPDWSTKEGRAVYGNMRKNGWQAYSIGSLQKDENGNAIIGEDGKPVYKYQSYERIDPLSTWIGLMVDFVNVSGFLTNDEYDEFMVGWVGAFSRNLIDRSYTRQVYEASRAIYDEKRREDFFARQLSARTPYANFVRYAKRLPGDLLDMIGQEKGEQFRQKRDLKVRKGDKAFGMDVSGQNEIAGASELRKYLNQLSETVPGYGAGRPYMREHITDEAILYPEKAGPDLFNFVRKSQSKNHPIFSALAKIAKPLREPSDVITGSATNSQIEPYRLTSNEYAELRKVVNNHIPASQEYGNNNLNDALKLYLKSSHYKKNIAIVERNGVEDSPIAVDKIYDKLRDINNYYIEEGENEWIRNSGTGRIGEQVQKKRDVQQNYLKELQSFSSN